MKIYLDIDINLENTIIFFDEIQESEELISALKYFNESKEPFKIICAGSLLGVKLKRMHSSFPVGKVKMLNMYPMDFEEFLMANGSTALIDEIKNCYKNNIAMDSVLHNKSLDLYRLYLCVGGMPESINNLLANDKDILKYDKSIIEDIYQSYLNDMNKYVENKFEASKIESIYKSIPSQLGNHDLRSMSSRKEVEKIMGYEHSTFSFDIEGLHIVVLGTFVNNEMGTAEGGIYKTQFLSDEDLKWLENDLNSNDLPCIVCVHFGVAEDNMKGNWWFESCPETALLGNRAELKKILKQDKNLMAVFSGHQHWTKKIVEDGIDYYVLGSMTENINNDGVPDGVYFIVEFDGKKLDVIEKHIRL